MATINLNEVCKVYRGGVKAVKDFNLKIKDGEFVILVGPSGCGKSTTLRMIAGLEEITSGQIYIDDVLVNDLEPKDRDIAMVFQNYALYPHMSIYDNLAYSLKCHHESKEVIEEKVHVVSKTLGIEEYLERKPKELSGGQRQRVALGRCLIRNPKVFLFDEPLSNLDAKLRVSMRSEISKLHKEVKGTFVYVTHDQTEAMTMADRIVVMKDGIVQQVDTPANLYEHPNNVFVATFLGSPQMNIFKGKLLKSEIVFGEDERIKLTLSDKTISKLGDKHNLDVFIGIRPSDFYMGSKEDYDFKVDKVELTEKLGNETLLYFTLPGREEYTLASLKLGMHEEINGEIYLKINKENVHLFNKDEESLLKVNEINLISSTIRMEDSNYFIENTLLKNFKEKMIGDELDLSKNYYLAVKTENLSFKEDESKPESLEVKVDAIDLYSDKKVVYAHTLISKDKVTFYVDKAERIETNSVVKVYFNIDECTYLNDELAIVALNKAIHKPILNLGLKRIRGNYYLLSEDKLFAKNKYFIVKQIFDLMNGEMLLNVINAKGEAYSVLVEKNDNLYVEMRLFIKFNKVK